MFYCRLHRHGLRALDVGEHGDCLFTTIIFQLHSHANSHSEIRTTGIQYLREETNKKPLTPGVVNPYCSVKYLSAQCSLHFFLSETKVKQSIVFIAISQCFDSIFHLINFITSSGTKEVGFLEILNDQFLTQLKFIPTRRDRVLLRMCWTVFACERCSVQKNRMCSRTMARCLLNFTPLQKLLTK